MNKENIDKLANWIKENPGCLDEKLQESALKGGASIDDFKEALSMVKKLEVGLIHRGVWIRALAQVIDIIILVALMWLLTSIPDNCNAKLMFDGEGEGLCGGLGVIIISLMIFAYPIVFEWKFGATIGKLIVGIKVVKITGEPISFSESLIRNLARMLDELPFCYLIGAISIWYTKKKQRIGDILAKTVVVSR